MEGILALPTWKELVMIFIALALVAVAVLKKYEPLLLLPIGIGILLVNLPYSPLKEAGSILEFLFRYGIKTEFFPLLIFISIGAMMDFRPLVERPWLIAFGAIAQMGIFATLIVALLLGFNLFQSASIGIIGSADGPTSIYVTAQLAPELIGSVSLAAYSYMALVPIIQPPIMRLLTTKKERKVRMEVGSVPVSDTVLKIFPYMILLLSALLSPMSIPLIGFLMFGNILATSGVTDSLAKAARETLSGFVTLFLGLTIGASMKAEAFLKVETLLIFLLGLVAFALGTAFGVLLGKFLHACGLKVNPLVGAAGLSSFPMSARLVHQMGQKEDKQNYLLMFAASANVSGQIGSVLAGGALLELVTKYGNIPSLQVGLEILLLGMAKVLGALFLMALCIYLLRKVLPKKDEQSS
ncbi:MAG: sodium ion-translocating decarboxylase subunit beta [Caldiserica bacterium]|jgi:oxaloacetate decarboxylase beta subunit|nr:sodium ion-translocating decarboxylase subunit beta [Caldisericota bacterium]MDH7562843.1 sodium ion-translocating decarboxylase subunit beta [Caldisericota bacterium]